MTNILHCFTIDIAMEIYATITPKFQVQIPVIARKKSGIRTHGKVRMIVKKGALTIKPVKRDVMKWAGKFSVKKPIPADKIRNYIDYSQA